jgi:hypothetical protein
MNPSLFSGLGDPRWLTGGYSFPPPPLILQGWGAGARPLIQGFHPAAPSPAVPGTVGIAHGGVKTIGAAFAAVVDGGMSVGGRSDVVPTGGSVYVGSGGIAHGAHKTLGAVLTGDGTGGSQVGGQATRSCAYLVDRPLGVRLGGAASWSRSYLASGGCGLNLGGESAPVVAHACSGVGGLSLGGAPEPTATHQVEQVVGLPHGGRSILVLPYQSAAGGGLAQGGEAVLAVACVPAVLPAMRQGGHAAFVRASSVAASGGVSEGGCSDPRMTVAPAAAGGMRRGGHPPVTARHTVDCAGGMDSSSAAAVSVAFAAAGAGGLAVGASGPIVRQDHRAGVAVGLAVGASGVPRATARPTIGGGLPLGGLARSGHDRVIAAAGGLPQGGLARTSLDVTFPPAGGLRLGGTELVDGIVYAVHMNAGAGDPIDYAMPVAVVEDPGWTSEALAIPGHYRFAVRARSTTAGLEERNLDAAVELVLDTEGRDVTDLPPAPVGGRAFPLAGGRVRVEWACPCPDARRQPDGFRVYLATVPSGDGAVVAAVVPRTDSPTGGCTATLEDLSIGTTYYINIRAFNAQGEEANTRMIRVVADGTPPALVDDLSAAATNQES